MKKKYLKPEAEYISLEVENIITLDDFDDEQGNGSALPDGWE